MFILFIQKTYSVQQFALSQGTDFTVAFSSSVLDSVVLPFHKGQHCQDSFLLASDPLSKFTVKFSKVELSERIHLSQESHQQINWLCCKIWLLPVSQGLQSLNRTSHLLPNIILLWPACIGNTKGLGFNYIYSITSQSLSNFLCCQYFKHISQSFLTNRSIDKVFALTCDYEVNVALAIV